MLSFLQCNHRLALRNVKLELVFNLSQMANFAIAIAAQKLMLASKVVNSYTEIKILLLLPNFSLNSWSRLHNDSHIFVEQKYSIENTLKRWQNFFSVSLCPLNLSFSLEAFHFEFSHWKRPLG